MGTVMFNFSNSGFSENSFTSPRYNRSPCLISLIIWTQNNGECFVENNNNNNNVECIANVIYNPTLYYSNLPRQRKRELIVYFFFQYSVYYIKILIKYTNNFF